MVTATAVTPEVATPFVAPAETVTAEAVTDPFAAALTGAIPETAMSRGRVDIILRVPEAIRKALEESYDDYQSDRHTPAGTPTFRTVEFADKATADAFKAHVRKYAQHRTDGRITVRATVTHDVGKSYVRFAAVPFVAKPRRVNDVPA